MFVHGLNPTASMRLFTSFTNVYIYFILLLQVDEQKTDKLKPFTFNVVFEPEASQEDILEHSGIKRLIDMGIDGFSTTAFCYGQTGSGKTHTLTGPPHLVRL